MVIYPDARVFVVLFCLVAFRCVEHCSEVRSWELIHWNIQLTHRYRYTRLNTQIIISFRFILVIYRWLDYACIAYSTPISHRPSYYRYYRTTMDFIMMKLFNGAIFNCGYLGIIIHKDKHDVLEQNRMNVSTNRNKIATMDRVYFEHFRNCTRDFLYSLFVFVCYQNDYPGLNVKKT